MSPAPLGVVGHVRVKATPSDLLAWSAVFLVAVVSMAIATSLMTPGWIGLLNDDGVYAATARAIALTHRLVLPHLPGEPPATLYPPGYPLLLTLTGAGDADVAGSLTRMQVLSLGSLGVFLGLIAGVWKRFLGASLGATLAALVLLGLSPQLVRLASQVMADVPLAALTAAAMLGTGLVLERGQSKAGWFGLGLGLAGLVLVKLQAITWVLAVVLLAPARRAVIAGFCLPVGAWVLWTANGTQNGYAELYRAMAGDGALLAAAGESIRMLLTSSVPASAFAPFAPPISNDPLWQNQHPALLLAGVGLSALMMTGLLTAWRAPRHDLERMMTLGLVLHLGLVAIWNTSFLFLGYTQAFRLLVPWLPACLWFLGRGALAAETRFWPDLPANRQRALHLGVVALALGVAIASTIGYREFRPVPVARTVGYDRAFRFLRDHTPAGSRIGSTLPAMTYLYTGRQGTTFPVDAAGRMIARVKSARLDHLFVLRGMYAYLDGGRDAYTGLREELDHLVPGLVETVYRDPEQGMEVWKVNRHRLQGP